MQDEIVEPPGSHEPTEYAQDAEEGGGQWLDRQRAGVLRLLHLRPGRRAGLPGHLLPRGQPAGRRSSRRFATFGVGYVARPIGAFVLGPLGRHARPQERAGAVHAADGRLDVPRRAAAHLRPGRDLAPDPAGDPAADPGLRGRRGDLRGQRHDRRARAVRPARLLRQLHPAGRAGRADHRRRRLPAAVHRAVRGGLPVVGLADPVPAQRARGGRRLHHPPPGRRDPGVPGGGRARRGARGADRAGGQGERPEHAAGDLHGADERRADRGDGLRRHLRHERGRVRHRHEHDDLPVDLGGRQPRRGGC